MNKLKNIWNERRGLAIFILALLVAVPVLMLFYPVWVSYLLVAGTSIVVVWLIFDSILSSRKRKRQSHLDERIAAKEGIEDRRREWMEWTKELSQAGIDRYELPFYLLVGEPQSGKSIMLQNSGLHFPLGQSKLSGPGGTKGCDWWFTEEAVVLDLAGRLFTHESGSSDASEWEAFLQLLADYRPLSPANGVLLVIPCDSLLQDSPEESERKATRIRESLLTLVNKLEAKLPIYLVLTKADKVFGFAESVHRMDGDRRRQMFGWSRPGDEFEEAFDLHELRKAFKELRNRAHLVRGEALSRTKVPDALPEIDRLFAFPEELETLEVPLVDYLRRIFTETEVSDRLFFRGLYLTSGLQQGKPIAQACAALMGSTSAEDSRDLEGLFTKQRAYFIRDFIQDRVFKERGLVRPTSERVKRSRKMAMLGYGAAAALAVVGALWMGYSTISSASPSEIVDYRNALESTQSYLAQQPDERGLDELLATLDWVEQAIETEELSAIDRAGKNNIEDFERLHADLVRADLARLTRAAAEEALEQDSQVAYQDCSYAHLGELAHTLDFLLGSMPVADGDSSRALGDFSLADPQDLEALAGLLARHPDLAPLVRPQVPPAGAAAADGPGTSVLQGVIARHLDYSSDAEPFGAARDEAPSPALKRAGANIAALYGRFLSSSGFGGGLQGEPEESTHLERVALLYRLGNSIQHSADQLLDPTGAQARSSVAGATVCDLISAGNAQLQRDLRDLEAFRRGYTAVSEQGFLRQLNATSELLGRILSTSGNQLPGAWSDFERHGRGLFASGGEQPLFRNWRRTPRGARSPGQRPRPAELPAIARRSYSALASFDAGADASSSSGSGAETYGELVVPDGAGVYAELKLDETAIARQVADCRKEVVQPGGEPQPSQLVEFIQAKLKINASLPSEAERAAAASFLRGQVAQVQDTYAALYQAAESSDEPLASQLGPGAEGQAAAQPFGLDLRVLEHLLEMQAALSGVDPGGEQLGDWSAYLEACLGARLARLKSSLEAATPAECAKLPASGLMDALLTLSSSGRFSAQLEGITGGYFAKRRTGLLDAWKAEADLAPGLLMAQLFAHLRLEKGFLDRGAANESLLQERATWLRDEVDEPLAQGARSLDERIQAYWRERAEVTPKDDVDLNLKQLARALRQRLEARELRAEFTRYASANHDFGVLLENYAKVQLELGEATPVGELLPKTHGLLATNQVGPLSAEESLEATVVTLDAVEVEELRAAARKLIASQVTGKLLSDASRSAGQVLELLEAAGEARRGDGARYFVASTLEAFQGALRAAVEGRYIAEFDQILRSHSDLLKSPIFLKDAEGSLAQYDLDDMHALLSDVYGLRRDFGLTGSLGASPDQEASLSPFEAGSPAAQWDDFLFELARFFDVGDGRSLGSRRFAFELAPGAGSFWRKYGQLKQETLGFWWPFGSGSPMIVGPSTKQQAALWEFGEDRTLFMGWNDSVEEPAKGSGNAFVLEGSFAPLVLIWHYGERDEDDARKQRLSIPVSAGEIPLEMKLPAGFPELPAKPLPMPSSS